MTSASQWGIEWYANQGGFDSATPVTAGTTATVADIRLDRRSTPHGRGLVGLEPLRDRVVERHREHA